MAPKLKEYFASFYFDMEVDDETPDYAVEVMLEKALDEILEAWNKKKKLTASGDMSYTDEVSVEYAKEDE